MLLLLSVGREHLPPAPARTHPTDSASGFVDSSETKTWQANLWSAGCLVMNPKYLRAERAGENGVSGRQEQASPVPTFDKGGPKPQWPPARMAQGCETHPKAAPRMKLWLTGEGEPSGWGCWRQEGSEASVHQGTESCPAPPATHLLFFGWYPQKEMFFSWKKWLHLFTWGKQRKNLSTRLPTRPAGQLVSSPRKRSSG